MIDLIDHVKEMAVKNGFLLEEAKRNGNWLLTRKRPGFAPDIVAEHPGLDPIMYFLEGYERANREHLDMNDSLNTDRKFKDTGKGYVWEFRE